MRLIEFTAWRQVVLVPQMPFTTSSKSDEPASIRPPP